jgi:hypothetical protein
MEYKINIFYTLFKNKIIRPAVGIVDNGTIHNPFLT